MLKSLRQSKSYKPDPNLLANRTILVTGAGDGIGRVAAIAYAKHGANLILLGRTRQKLDSVHDEIAEHTGQASLIIPIDLTHFDATSAIELKHGLEGEYSRLDGILHNASILGPKTLIEGYPYDKWIQVFQVNLHSAYLITQAALPLLRKAPDASIVFTSSGVGRRGRAYWGAYSLSKFATEGLTQVLADELSEDSNIRVNSLNPGATRTSMRAQAFPSEDPDTLPTAEEHMPLYLYLMGPDSSKCTGMSLSSNNWSY
ncbi:MAG: YciK family oxidoreductase [Gammaproteobacteria bacterium]|nr:YciK family oxidoreductase [Gammaproteobacteria bacterium]